MSAKYLICTKEEYEQGLADEVKLDVTVKKHAPIYSTDGTEVLVKGIGDMSLADVKEYKSNSDAWAVDTEEL